MTLLPARVWIPSDGLGYHLPQAAMSTGLVSGYNPSQTKMGDQKRSRVFILGAGASKAAGLPLTSELLELVFSNPAFKHRDDLLGFIQYLYPGFRHNWKNYPNIEELLSLFDVFLSFNEKIKGHHKFSNRQVKRLRKSLLLGIAECLIQEQPKRQTKVFELARVLQATDFVVSFNWDLTLERALFDQGRNWEYRTTKGELCVLKPHGSLDWFDSSEVDLRPNRSFKLDRATGSISVYQYFHLPRLKKSVVPVIIAPTLYKRWEHPEFDRIWKDIWRALRYADEVNIIGFSWPVEDLHIRFVVRTALRANERFRRTKIVIRNVNPDLLATQRLRTIVDCSDIRTFQTTFENLELREILRG